MVVKVRFDGEVFRPEVPVDLPPDTTYIISIEDQVAPEVESSAEIAPLAALLALATDMGVTDLAERHHEYAHGLERDVTGGE